MDIGWEEFMTMIHRIRYPGVEVQYVAHRLPINTLICREDGDIDISETCR